LRDSLLLILFHTVDAKRPVTLCYHSTVVFIVSESSTTFFF